MIFHQDLEDYLRSVLIPELSKSDFSKGVERKELSKTAFFIPFKRGADNLREILSKEAENNDSLLLTYFNNAKDSKVLKFALGNQDVLVRNIIGLIARNGVESVLDDLGIEQVNNENRTMFFEKLSHIFRPSSFTNLVAYGV